MEDAPLKGIPNDEEFLSNISKAIGFLVFNFAMLEFSLNGIIATAYHKMNGRKLVNKMMPSAFGQVLMFIRSSARKVPELQPHRQELLDIAQEAKRLSGTRNGVVHGYLSEYDESKNHRLIFRSISARKPPHDMHHERVLTTTAAKLMADGAATHALSARTVQLCHRIVQPVVAKTLARKSARRVRRKTAARGKVGKRRLK